MAIATACTQFDVRVARDPAVDLTRSRSWAWLPADLVAPADQQLPDRYFERKLTATVDRVLSAKGFEQSAEKLPDLFINYRLTTSDRTDVDLPSGYGLGWWAHDYRVHVDRYDVGTLILDVIDARTRTLVWRGTAAARLLPHASLEKRARRTEEVVEQILEAFPERQRS
jgi:hypothetical protein